MAVVTGWTRPSLAPADSTLYRVKSDTWDRDLSLDSSKRIGRP